MPGPPGVGEAGRTLPGAAKGAQPRLDLSLQPPELGGKRSLLPAPPSVAADRRGDAREPGAGSVAVGPVAKKHQTWQNLPGRKSACTRSLRVLRLLPPPRPLSPAVGSAVPRPPSSSLSPLRPAESGQEPRAAAPGSVPARTPGFPAVWNGSWLRKPDALAGQQPQSFWRRWVRAAGDGIKTAEKQQLSGRGEGCSECVCAAVHAHVQAVCANFWSARERAGIRRVCGEGVGAAALGSVRTPGLFIGVWAVRPVRLVAEEAAAAGAQPGAPSHTRASRPDWRVQPAPGRPASGREGSARKEAPPTRHTPHGPGGPLHVRTQGKPRAGAQERDEAPLCSPPAQTPAPLPKGLALSLLKFCPWARSGVSGQRARLALRVPTSQLLAPMAPEACGTFWGTRASPGVASPSVGPPRLQRLLRTWSWGGFGSKLLAAGLRARAHPQPPGTSAHGELMRSQRRAAPGVFPRSEAQPCDPSANGLEEETCPEVLGKLILPGSFSPFLESDGQKWSPWALGPSCVAGGWQQHNCSPLGPPNESEEVGGRRASARGVIQQVPRARELLTHSGGVRTLGAWALHSALGRVHPTPPEASGVGMNKHRQGPVIRGHGGHGAEARSFSKKSLGLRQSVSNSGGRGAAALAQVSRSLVDNTANLQTAGHARSRKQATRSAPGHRGRHPRAPPAALTEQDPAVSRFAESSPPPARRTQPRRLRPERSQPGRLVRVTLEASDSGSPPAAASPRLEGPGPLRGLAVCSLESSFKGKVRNAGTCVLTSGRAMHRATPPPSSPNTQEGTGQAGGQRLAGGSELSGVGGLWLQESQAGRGPSSFPRGPASTRTSTASRSRLQPRVPASPVLESSCPAPQGPRKGGPGSRELVRKAACSALGRTRDLGLDEATGKRAWTRAPGSSDGRGLNPRGGPRGRADGVAPLVAPPLQAPGRCRAASLGARHPQRPSVAEDRLIMGGAARKRGPGERPELVSAKPGPAIRVPSQRRPLWTRPQPREGRLQGQEGPHSRPRGRRAVDWTPCLTLTHTDCSAPEAGEHWALVITTPRPRPRPEGPETAAAGAGGRQASAPEGGVGAESAALAEALEGLRGPSECPSAESTSSPQPGKVKSSRFGGHLRTRSGVPGGRR
ncbi:collagen alpha-1(I) chain-like [Hyaena hyaena]|uniref:collagen alpha-1(I) chain-like n=1 Tax=Hyaena hyaena TaxID=95912 RepID=UPI0019246A04|nr:collagen alpha-1(I) chain-like [Hyaena hyaena]